MVPRRAAVDFLCFPMVNHLLSPVTQEVSAYHLPEQTLSMRKSGPIRVRFEPRKRPLAAFRVQISGLCRKFHQLRNRCSIPTLPAVA